MTLTKAKLTETITQNTGLPARENAEILESLIDIIKDTLASGEDVLISRFGKFCIKKKNRRKGRNPATGEDMLLDERKIVTFKCSANLRDKVN